MLTLGVFLIATLTAVIIVAAAVAAATVMG
jgi:hypothetical protein